MIILGDKPHVYIGLSTTTTGEKGSVPDWKGFRAAQDHKGYKCNASYFHDSMVYASAIFLSWWHTLGQWTKPTCCPAHYILEVVLEWKASRISKRAVHPTN